MSDWDLLGRVAIITGASSPIGEATARCFAEHGGSVVLAAREWERIQTLCDEINVRGGKAFAVVTDVSARSQVNHLVGVALERFGRVDVLINNADQANGPKISSVEDWDRTIDVNIKGVLYGMSAVLPLFKEQRRGHIVNVVTNGELSSDPRPTLSSASRLAVQALSEGMRRELNPLENIRVTMIAPGAVQNEFYEEDPHDRVDGVFQSKIENNLLKCEDIANAIIYAITQPEKVNVDEIIVMPRERYDRSFL